MSVKHGRYRLSVMTAAVAIGLLFCTDSFAQIRRLSIGTADTGGVYYIYGGAIAKVISANVAGTVATAEVTPGAVDNVKMLQNGSIDLAFTKSDVAAEAIKGVGPFAGTGKVQVRVIAVLYPDIAHVVVIPSINKLEDMKGKRISTSAPGSGHEMVALKLLEAAGVNPLKDFRRERISLSESANAFKDRKLDGFFFATGLPASAMLDLSPISCSTSSPTSPPSSRSTAASITTRSSPKAPIEGWRSMSRPLRSPCSSWHLKRWMKNWSTR